MDNHKMQRSARLKAWLDANGGPTRCLIGAGYDPGTKEFKSRESWISQSIKKGIGHVGAVRFEREFEAFGMQPGALTNNLDEEMPDRRSAMEDRPLMHMDVLDLGDLTPDNTAHGLLLVFAPDGVPPDVPRNSVVSIDLNDKRPEDGRVALAQTVAGAFALGVCRVVVGGFELDTGRAVLDDKRHGLRIAGLATELRKTLTKVTYKTT